MNHHIIGVVLAQKFSLKAGLNKFGNTGDKFSVKELTRIHYMKTFLPLDPTKVTREYRTKSLLSLMFQVDKRYGTIKARYCANGIKQRRDDSYNRANPDVQEFSVYLVLEQVEIYLTRS